MQLSEKLTDCGLTHADAGQGGVKGPAKASIWKAATRLSSPTGMAQMQIPSLYLDLGGLRGACEIVTAVCVEVLFTQPLAVKSIEQALTLAALLLLATSSLRDHAATETPWSRTEKCTVPSGMKG